MDDIKVGRLGPFPRVNKPVFIISGLLIVGFIIYGALFTEQAGVFFSFLQTFISTNFGWLFIILYYSTYLWYFVFIWR